MPGRESASDMVKSVLMRRPHLKWHVSEVVCTWSDRIKPGSLLSPTSSPGDLLRRAAAVGHGAALHAASPAAQFCPGRLAPSPACWARRTASARSATWSLAKTFDTWLRIVFGLSCRLRAIWGLVWYWARSARIWCSRSVGSGKASTGALGRGVAKKSIRRLVIAERRSPRRWRRHGPLAGSRP
jgi:hypothetical protein